MARIERSPPVSSSSCVWARHGSPRPACAITPPTTRDHSGKEAKGVGPLGSPAVIQRVTNEAMAERISPRFSLIQPSRSSRLKTCLFWFSAARKSVIRRRRRSRSSRKVRPMLAESE